MLVFINNQKVKIGINIWLQVTECKKCLKSNDLQMPNIKRFVIFEITSMFESPGNFSPKRYDLNQSQKLWIRNKKLQ